MRPKCRGTRASGSRWLFWLCLIAASAGCSGEDADRLARVYHRSAARFEDESAGTRGKLSRGWHSLQGDPLAGASLRDRVAARLRLDRALTEAGIEVDADEDVITLRGEVGAEQRRRAVDLAESTIGVEKVVNELTTGK
ncbi:MAG: BON domain-containing protein [Planctomycetes bacterium]|nr:BON domain-containing protein [Planctomycetota bacterium]